MQLDLNHDVVCPTLIGRDAPGRWPCDASSTVHAREMAGVALIVGEAGVGKSRLLRAMTEEARAAGFFVLHGGRASRPSASIPYAPLLDLVRLFAELGVAGDRRSRARAGRSRARDDLPRAARLFFPTRRPSATIDPESDKRRLFHALAQVVTLLARTQPVFIAFEDVHWSDDATLELVFHLARSHASQPVVIALTYRGEEAGPRLARLVADLERARVVTELPVERLGRDDVGAMLAGDLRSAREPRRRVRAPAARAHRGESVLRRGDAQGADRRRRSRADAAVAGARDRSSACACRAPRPKPCVAGSPRSPVPARAVASTAAVAGRRFDFGLLQTLTESRRAGAARAGQGAHRRAARRRGVGRAVRVPPRAHPRGDLRRAAGTRARRAAPRGGRGARAPRTPTRWTRSSRRSRTTRGRRATGSAPRRMRHARPHTRMRCRRRARRWATSTAHSRRPSARGSQPGIELHLARGRANETLGEFQRANDDFNAALERARAVGEPARGVGSAARVRHAVGGARLRAAGEYRRDALTVARALGDESLVARSLNRVGNWHVNLEEPHAGLPHHEEALAIFERLGDPRGVAETVDLIAMAHHVGGDQRAAASYYERSVALFTQMDDRRGLANALGIARAMRAVVPVVGDDAVHEPGRARRAARAPRSIRSRARSAGAPARRSCGSSSPTASAGAANTTARIPFAREGAVAGARRSSICSGSQASRRMLGAHVARPAGA